MGGSWPAKMRIVKPAMRLRLLMPLLPACRYVGVMHMEFLQYCAGTGVPVGPLLTAGNGMDFLIGRISYTFGLTGPCVR